MKLDKIGQVRKVPWKERTKFGQKVFVIQKSISRFWVLVRSVSNFVENRKHNWNYIFRNSLYCCIEVVVQLLIMYGEMEMENQEIYWATIAQEYCQTHFSMQGNSRSDSGNYF